MQELIPFAKTFTVVIVIAVLIFIAGATIQLQNVIRERRRKHKERQERKKEVYDHLLSGPDSGRTISEIKDAIRDTRKRLSGDDERAASGTVELYFLKPYLDELVEEGLAASHERDRDQALRELRRPQMEYWQKAGSQWRETELRLFSKEFWFPTQTR